MTEDDSGLDNHGKPREEYVNRLKKISDQALEGEAGLKIWLSALAENNPRSDYHWQCDACFDEAERRGKPEIYDRAWDEAAGSLKPQKKALPRNILDTRTGTRLPIILMKSAEFRYRRRQAKAHRWDPAIRAGRKADQEVPRPRPGGGPPPQEA